MSNTNRIIRCITEGGGQISEQQKNKAKAINLNPVFTEEKPWKFIKVLKSGTGITPWLIQINDEYIVVCQGFIPRKTEMVMFYRSNKKGTFSIPADRITEYWTYVDIEAAVDKFYAEFYAEVEIEKLIANEEA